MSWWLAAVIFRLWLTVTAVVNILYHVCMPRFATFSLVLSVHGHSKVQSAMLRNNRCFIKCCVFQSYYSAVRQTFVEYWKRKYIRTNQPTILSNLAFYIHVILFFRFCHPTVNQNLIHTSQRYSTLNVKHLIFKLIINSVGCW